MYLLEDKMLQSKEDVRFEQYKQNRDKEIEQLKANLLKFQKANDEKNAFLEKLGISTGGEFRRISFYINQFRDENAKLREQLRQKEQEKLMLEIALSNAKAALVSKQV